MSLNHRTLSGAMTALLTVVALAAQAHAQTPVDLNSWSQQGQPTHSNWNVEPDGSSVLQTINGGVGLFVSPNEFFNTTVQGSFGVETTSDNDFIGFVFGYQAPIDQTDTVAQRTVDFLLLDWKQSAQSGAPEGFRLSHVDGTHDGSYSSTGHELWDHIGNTAIAVTPLGTDTGTDRGWQDPVGGVPVEYDFTLLYTASQIRIDIAGGQFGTGETLFDLDFANLDPAVQALFPGGQFEPGRFGFYNHSQQSVRYQSFTLTEAELATAPDDGGTLNFLARVGSSDNQTVNVGNSGGAGSQLTGTAGSPAGAPFSGPAGPSAFSLGAGQDNDFVYTFSPTARGVSSDSIDVQSNEDTHTIDFQGVGVGPIFDSSVTPGSLIDLGTAPLSIPLDALLQIGNVTPDDDGGNADLTNLTLDSLITGDDASMFTVDLAPDSVVGKGGLLDIIVTFLGDPAPGTYTATLTLLTDEGAALGDLVTGQSYSFDLTATVIPEPATALLVALGAVAMVRRRA